MPSAQCSVLSAQCSVPSAQCSVLSAQCPVRSAQCSMPSAQCPVPSAQCSVLSAQCSVLYCYFMTPTTTSRSTAAAIATTTAITILLGHLRHTKSYPEGVAQPSIASRGKSMHAIGFRREEARSRMKVRMTNACKRAISIAITCIVCQATLLATRDPRRQHLFACRTSGSLRVDPTVCSRL